MISVSGVPRQDNREELRAHDFHNNRGKNSRIHLPMRPVPKIERQQNFSSLPLLEMSCLNLP
jgi:hypothetical protein